jgi:hypothetical protein
MSNADLNITGRRILKLLVQFLILLVSFIYIDYVYFTNILPDQRARINFRETECLMLSKKLSTKGKIFHRARADFLVSYRANGTQYNRWVSGNGLDMNYTMSIASQELVLAEYQNGRNYTCWYNPDNAEMVALSLRHSWVSLYFLIIPVIAGLVALILFLRNIWQLVRMSAPHKH